MHPWGGGGWGKRVMLGPLRFRAVERGQRHTPEPRNLDRGASDSGKRLRHDLALLDRFRRLHGRMRVELYRRLGARDAQPELLQPLGYKVDRSAAVQTRPDDIVVRVHVAQRRRRDPHLRLRQRTRHREPAYGQPDARAVQVRVRDQTPDHLEAAPHVKERRRVVTLVRFLAALARAGAGAFLGRLALGAFAWAKGDVIHKQVQILLAVESSHWTLLSPLPRGGRGVRLVRPKREEHVQRVVRHLREHVLVLALALAPDPYAGL